MSGIDPDEWNAQFQKPQAKLARAKLDAKSEVIAAFREKCASRGVKKDELNIKYEDSIGIVAEYPNLLLLLDPGLKRDHEGLLSCRLLRERYQVSRMHAGYLRAEFYDAMCSPYFRRAMSASANWAPHFIDEFWVIEDPGIVASINLESDRVRVDGLNCLEDDTWYGSPFDSNIMSLPDGSTYLRPPGDIKPSFLSLFFASTYALEVNWSTKRGFRTFQALEFKNEDVRVSVGASYRHPVRYLHAEYSDEHGCFVHFDGAVQLFSDAEYLQRRDSSFSSNVNTGAHVKADSSKIFKLNGTVPVELWVKLTSHFMTGNPLVMEYFTGNLPSNVTDAVDKMRHCPDMLT